MILITSRARRQNMRDNMLSWNNFYNTLCSEFVRTQPRRSERGGVSERYPFKQLMFVLKYCYSFCLYFRKNNTCDTCASMRFSSQDSHARICLRMMSVYVDTIWSDTTHLSKFDNQTQNDLPSLGVRVQSVSNWICGMLSDDDHLDK